MRASLFALPLALVALSVSRAADPAPPKFDKLPADAEVHMVGVYGPLFSSVGQEEITDWKGLVLALRVKDGPGAHVRKQLTERADEVLAEGVEMGKLGDYRPEFVPAVVKREFSKEFTRTINEKVYYDKDAFAEVALPKPVKELVELGERRTVFQTARMNRELLALAFPGCVAPAPPDFQTVHVTVKAGRPVVLVLSASLQTRWKVAVEKGATVAGVVLFGSQAQEVTGVDAPVVYLASSLPSGKRSGQPGLNGWKQGTKELERVTAVAKEITGKDFASFQGQSRSGKEPFVVRPGAK